MLLISSFFVNAQNKQKDYLVSYTDSTSGTLLLGYKNVQGKVIIPAQYLALNEDPDTLYQYTYVMVPKIGWMLIDKGGKHILQPFIYDNGPDYESEGLFRFVENGKIGFANLKYKKVIPATFDFVTPFKDGLAEYTIGGHKIMDGEHWYWGGGYEKGSINRAGQKFKKVNSLNKGSREAWTLNNQHVLLDKKGNIIKWFKPN